MNNPVLACNQYASEKTNFSLTIYESCSPVRILVTSEQRIYTCNDVKDENGNITEDIKITYKTAKEKQFSIKAQKTSDNYIDHLLQSEFIASYIDSVSMRFVRTNLKTVYTKSANKRIYQLLRQAEQYYFGYNTQSYSNYETYEEHNAQINDDSLYIEDKEGDIIPISDCISKKDYTKPEEINHFMEVVTHNYKMVKDSNGKLHKVEIIPYNELKLTKFGRKICANMELKNLTVNDVLDLISACKIACYELINSGMIHSFNDFNIYRKYCYARINQEIDRQKAIKAKETQEDNNASETETDDYIIDGSTEEITDDSATEETKIYHEKTFKTVETASVKECLVNYAISKLDKRTKKEQVKIAFEMYLDGYNGVDIAKVLPVGEMTVSKYLSYCKKALNNNASETRRIVNGTIDGNNETTYESNNKICFAGTKENRYFVSSINFDIKSYK